MLCVKDRRFARIASKRNKSIGRVAGFVDAYQFFINSAKYIYGTARTDGIGGMLNGAPRRLLSAGIRIIPGG
jgi:hypothetical protein